MHEHVDSLNQTINGKPALRHRVRGGFRGGFFLALLSLAACQGGGGDPAQARGKPARTRHMAALQGLSPLRLTLAPGVGFAGCVVIEPVSLETAEAGKGLECPEQRRNRAVAWQTRADR